METHMYYVYILQGDNKHYIWSTKDIVNRLEKHRRGHTQTTKSMGHLHLIWYFEKQTKSEALHLEKMIKKDGHILHWLNHSTFIHVWYGGCSSVG